MGHFILYTHFIQLILCLCLHTTNIYHIQLHPLINPAEELAVEVIEDPLLLLRDTEVVWVRA